MHLPKGASFTIKYTGHTKFSGGQEGLPSTLFAHSLIHGDMPGETRLFSLKSVGKKRCF